MLLQRLTIFGILAISVCFNCSLQSQQILPPKSTNSSNIAPPASTLSPSKPVKPFFQKPAPKPPGFRPPPPPPPSFAPPGHPQPYITKGDAKQIFSLIENQLNAIQHQDFQTAYYDYTSTAFKNATTLDDFIFFATGYPAFTHNKSSMFSHIDLKNNIATLQGTLTSSTAQVLNVEYYFILENGVWKIIGIQVFPKETLAPLKPSPLKLPEKGLFKEPPPINKSKEQTFKMQRP